MQPKQPHVVRQVVKLESMNPVTECVSQSEQEGLQIC